MAEYKNPLLDAIVDIKRGNFDKKYNSMLYAINRWNSGCDKYGKFINFNAAFTINKYLFIVPQKMTMSYMHCTYKLHNMRGQPALFLKFPKKSESKKNEKFAIVKKYLKKIYDWSDSEIEKNINVISYYVENKDFIDWLNNYVGFDKKEQKIFGIKCNLKVVKKIDKEIIIENSNKSLFDY